MHLTIWQNWFLVNFITKELKICKSWMAVLGYDFVFLNIFFLDLSDFLSQEKQKCQDPKAEQFFKFSIFQW